MSIALFVGSLRRSSSVSVITLTKALLSGIAGIARGIVGIARGGIADKITGVAGVVSSSSKPMNEGARVDIMDRSI